MVESPNVVKPKCNHFYICSKIQNLSYKEQLKEKSNQVIDAFQRLGGFKDFKLNNVVKGNQFLITAIKWSLHFHLTGGF